MGQVAFEVGLTAATAGAGTALNAAAKTSRVARMALRAARIADVEGHAMSLAGRAARSAAGRMKMLGKVLTGAKKARHMAAAARKTKSAIKRSALGKKLKAVQAYVKRKRKCLWDPIDVASGVMLFDQADWEMPGPLPFVWERHWYSNSAYAGPLGHGWHHSFDAALLADAGSVAVRLPDGRLAVFAPPATADGPVFNRAERLELRRDAAGHYRVFSLDERRSYCFAPLPADAPRPADTAADEAPHRLSRVEDPNGFAIRLAYDAQGHLRTLTDCAGRAVRLHCDASGRVTALEVPQADGREHAVVVRYAYDEAGHLLAATDALGQALRYAYRADHLMVQKTFRTGGSFYFEYAGTGPAAQCVRTWGDGNVLNGRLEFQPGRTIARTDAAGDVSVYEHAEGLVTRHTDPVGAVRESTYDPHGDLVMARDPLGRATGYEYDARGNPTQISYPDGAKVRTQYNAQDLPTQVTDANGGGWIYSYDAVGNLLTRTDPAGEVRWSR